MCASAVPDLPLPFRGVALRERGGAFARACRLAPTAEPATLVWAARRDTADLAVVLTPKDDLVEARLAVFAGLDAAAGALSEIGPDGTRLLFAWPDAMLCDGGPVGGARVAWPEGTAEDAVPDWLVLGVTLRVDTIRGVDQRTRPTALRDAGFAAFEMADFVGRFARRLKEGLDEWAIEGPRSPMRRWQRRAPALLLSPTGDLLHPACALSEALAVPSWLDPMSGEVRA
jgi:hypothetical protein